MLRNFALVIAALALAGTSISSTWAQSRSKERTTFIHKCTATCKKDAGRRCSTTCVQKAEERGY